jgi:hypothetical protein
MLCVISQNTVFIIETYTTYLICAIMFWSISSLNTQALHHDRWLLLTQFNVECCDTETFLCCYEILYDIRCYIYDCVRMYVAYSCNLLLYLCLTCCIWIKRRFLMCRHIFSPTSSSHTMCPRHWYEISTLFGKSRFLFAARGSSSMMFLSLSRGIPQ